jgi:secretion/DNA translocation related TadE-like protein
VRPAAKSFTRLRPSAKALNRAQGLDQRGSGSILMIGAIGALWLFGLGVMCMATYLAALHHVRGAADLAALSGAVAVQAGEDGCAASRRVASANETSLLACDRVGDAVDFVISVKVVGSLRLNVPGLPTKIIGFAHAGPR